MSFNSNIPLATDAMIKSQRQIRSNFQAIKTVFAENHAAFNSEFHGMHNSLTFREQVADPITAVDQVALYTKAVSSVTNLFFRPSNNQTAIQMTYPSVNTGIVSFDPDVYLSQQQSFIAGPFIVYAGLILGASTGNFVSLSPTSTIIYAGAKPINTATVGPSTVNNVIAVISGSGFNFQWSGLTGPVDVYYLAIGQP